LKDTWRSLNQKLSSLSEDELKGMLEEELQGAKRVSILQRLHQRYCTLRQTRERIELVKEAQRV
jgi:hypothetical protein